MKKVIILGVDSFCPPLILTIGLMGLLLIVSSACVRGKSNTQFVIGTGR